LTLNNNVTVFQGKSLTSKRLTGLMQSSWRVLAVQKSRPLQRNCSFLGWKHHGHGGPCVRTTLSPKPTRTPHSYRL